MKFLPLAVVVLLCACSARSSNDEQVRALLAAMENAAQARDASDVLDGIATDYTDSRGFDREQLQRFLRGYFLANPRIEVLTQVQDLQFPVDGLGRARIAVTVLPAGDRATLQVEFRKQAGRWVVSRADSPRD